jgi:tripeptide aminopeptidase
MEKIEDRFLRYVSVDTQSNEESESQPSTANQLNLLKMLCDELLAMGVKAELDEYGYVMGTIPASEGFKPRKSALSPMLTLPPDHLEPTSSHR